jgi:3-oxoacyl-[acyl-carrier-protein] synthase-3
MGVRIAGLGGALPPLEVTNEDLEKRLDTTSEWIVSRTGILKRYAVTEGISWGHTGCEGCGWISLDVQIQESPH